MNNPETKPHNKWKIFTVVAVGVFMSTLDSSMVNVALPSIMRDFASPLNRTEWVVMIYLLTITATLLLWGNLSDIFGRKKIYSTGMIIFAFASLACSYSTNLSMLIISRFLQALGASMMMSTGPAIIRETFPPHQLGRSLGFIGIAVSLGLMTGPPLSGFLIDLFSWRSIFFCTVPVGLFFFIFARIVLPPHSEVQKTTAPFDWPGALAWAILLTSLSLALSHAASPERNVLFLGIPLAVAFIALILFGVIESRAAAPILPLLFFTKRYFTVGITSAALSFLVLFAAIMLTPFYLANILGLKGSGIGLVMMAVPLAVMIVAPLAGWLYDHFGEKYLTTCGLLLSTLGVFLLSGLTSHSSQLEVVMKLALLGFGQAMFLSPNSASVLGRVHKKHNGISAALLATARNLGMLLGIALSSLVFSYYFSRHTSGLDMKDFSGAQIEAFMLSLKKSFQAAASLGMLGACISWFREKR
ncbi:MAG: MFS transporter [Proteobacteria bacterium]|nr:MFS transporter [Pseudomonadota bacterium]MBU1708425.1 MFS transporter [Pseudomonadota bacterium]